MVRSLTVAARVRARERLSQNRYLALPLPAEADAQDPRRSPLTPGPFPPQRVEGGSCLIPFGESASGWAPGAVSFCFAQQQDPAAVIHPLADSSRDARHDPPSTRCGGKGPGVRGRGFRTCSVASGGTPLLVLGHPRERPAPSPARERGDPTRAREQAAGGASTTADALPWSAPSRSRLGAAPPPARLPTPG